MEFAVNFLKSNVGIESPALLSSPFMMVTLARYGHARHYELTPEESERLRFWVLLANAKGRYSRGSSETILDQDLSIIRDGGGAEELLNRLRLQVGRLDITPGELEGRNQRSALFKTMFLAFRAAGATDWLSNLTISLGHKGNIHKLQFHHIFAKALLKNKVSDREADDISNLAFIAGKTNRGISDKTPREYIIPLLEKNKEKPFSSQCIPVDPKLLELHSYHDFLAERRRRVADRLNDFLGVNS